MRRKKIVLGKSLALDTIYECVRACCVRMCVCVCVRGDWLFYFSLIHFVTLKFGRSSLASNKKEKYKEKKKKMKNTTKMASRNPSGTQNK